MGKLFKNIIYILSGVMLMSTFAFANDPVVKVQYTKPLASALEFMPRAQVPISCGGDFIKGSGQQPQDAVTSEPNSSYVKADIVWTLPAESGDSYCMNTTVDQAKNPNMVILKGNGQLCTDTQLCKGGAVLEYLGSNSNKMFSAKVDLDKLQNAAFYNNEQNKYYYFIGCFDVWKNDYFVCCFSSNPNATSCQ